MVSLNSKDGKDRWRKKVGRREDPVLLHGVALIIKNHVIAGVGGDAMDMPGSWKRAIPETGDVQWRWNTTPRKGEPGADTWRILRPWNTAAA